MPARGQADGETIPRCKKCEQWAAQVHKNFGRFKKAYALYKQTGAHIWARCDEVEGIQLPLQGT